MEKSRSDKGVPQIKTINHFIGTVSRSRFSPENTHSADFEGSPRVLPSPSGSPDSLKAMDEWDFEEDWTSEDQMQGHLVNQLPKASRGFQGLSFSPKSYPEEFKEITEVQNPETTLLEKQFSVNSFSYKKKLEEKSTKSPEEIIDRAKNQSFESLDMIEEDEGGINPPTPRFGNISEYSLASIKYRPK